MKASTKIISMTLGLCFMALVLPQAIFACDCGTTWKPDVVPGDYVFSGKMVFASSTSVLGREMFFEVSRVWKGDIGTMIKVLGSVRTGANCGWVAPDDSEEWIVIASGKNIDSLYTDSCIGNTYARTSKIPELYGPGYLPNSDVESPILPQGALPASFEHMSFSWVMKQASQKKAVEENQPQPKVQPVTTPSEMESKSLKRSSRL